MKTVFLLADKELNGHHTVTGQKRGCHHSVSGTITEGQHCRGGATLSLGKLLRDWLGVGHSPSIFSWTELFSLFILCNYFFFCCSGLSVHACVGLFQPLHSAGKARAHVCVGWVGGEGGIREVTNLKELYLTGGCLHWHWIPQDITYLYSHLEFSKKLKQKGRA